MPARAPLPTPSPPRQSRPAWRWLRRRFGFSRTETSGLLVLLALVVLLGLGLPLLLQPAAPTYLPAADQRQLDAWASALGARLDSARAAAPTYASRYPRRGTGASRFPAVPQVRLAPFNPNALSAPDWEARGVPHFVAGRIVNYGQKAGGFRVKSQVQRIYGLPDSVYQRLAPFMQLPEALPGRGGHPTAGGALPAYGPGYATTAPATRFPRKPAHLAAFDLNLADTTQLRQIKGIGQGRAKWIVKRRDELGGFVSEDQLREVFVLRDAPDLVDSLRKYTFVAAGFAPRPVHINSGSFDELYPHPYVRKNLARLIVAFRNQHGPYKTPDDLLQIKLLKPTDFEQLRPYVRCD